MYMFMKTNINMYMYKHVLYSTNTVHEQFENEHKQIHQHIQYSTETCALICIRTCIQR